MIQDADAVGHGHGLDLVVGDIQQRGAEFLLDALQLDAHLAAQLGVERGQWLVHQIDRRAAHQGAADRDALHLAAGKLRRPVLELGADPQHLGDRGYAPLDLRLRHPARGRAQREGEIVEHRQMRIERVLLEDEGDVAGRGLDRR